MPPSSSAAAPPAQELVAVGRTKLLHSPKLPSPPRVKKFRSMEDIMRRAKHVELEHEYYGQVACVQCESGDRDDQLLLCDKCDRGYHMLCLRANVKPRFMIC